MPPRHRPVGRLDDHRRLAPARRSALAGQATQNSDIPPTITTRQGAQVRIFVARDLDFSARRAGAMNIVGTTSLSRRLPGAAGRRILSRADVTDLYINRPGELWLETAGGIERHDVPALDDASLWRLARQIAASSDQGINREHPLLAATLPDGARVQICAPPATRGNVIVAIRKHSMPDLAALRLSRRRARSRGSGEAALARDARSTPSWPPCSTRARRWNSSPPRCAAQDDRHLGRHRHRQDDLPQRLAQGSAAERAVRADRGHARNPA